MAGAGAWRLRAVIGREAARPPQVGAGLALGEVHRGVVAPVAAAPAGRGRRCAVTRERG